MRRHGDRTVFTCCGVVEQAPVGPATTFVEPPGRPRPDRDRRTVLDGLLRAHRRPAPGPARRLPPARRARSDHLPRHAPGLAHATPAPSPQSLREDGFAIESIKEPRLRRERIGKRSRIACHTGGGRSAMSPRILLLSLLDRMSVAVRCCRSPGDGLARAASVPWLAPPLACGCGRRACGRGC
jgi:hypothetical protein